MIRRPPRSTLFPYTRSSDLESGQIHRNDVKRLLQPGDVVAEIARRLLADPVHQDRKSTRLNSSHLVISYAVFCLKKKHTTSPLSLLSTSRCSSASSQLEV